jgi:hypothetical protein
MDRIPVLDVEESASLTENLSFVIGLDSETLLGIAATETLLQFAKHGFDHCRAQNWEAILTLILVFGDGSAPVVRTVRAVALDDWARCA